MTEKKQTQFCTPHFFVLQPAADFVDGSGWKILFSVVKNQILCRYIHKKAQYSQHVELKMLWICTVELTDWGVAVPSWAVKDQVRTIL